MLDSSTEFKQLESFLKSVAKTKYVSDKPPPIKRQGILTYYDNNSLKQCHIQILSSANKRNEFDLSYNWDNFGMHLFIKNIVCWDIQQNFHLNYNKSIAILKQIEDVAFPKLKQLQLNSNLIESVEGICNMHTPNLQRLSIRDNKISYIKSLRKLLCHNLKYLNIQSNFIKDLHYISEIINNQSKDQNSTVQHDKCILISRPSKYTAKVKNLYHHKI